MTKPKLQGKKKKKANFLPTMGGLRLTRQRQAIYRILLGSRDHPNIAKIHERAGKVLPNVSLATVYNCVDALVAHKLVCQTNFHRDSARYCPNNETHGHFYNLDTDEVLDIKLTNPDKIREILALPADFNVGEIEIIVRGNKQHQELPHTA